MAFTSSADTRKQALAAGAVLLVMMAGHTVLETARDALFLARLSVRELPWTYGAIALAALLAVEGNARLRGRVHPRLLLSLTLITGAAGCLGFLFAFQAHASWAPHAFYVWLAVIATLATAQFWLLINERFTVLQAKSAFALVSAGGLVGAMLGGGLARALAERTGLVWLLPIGAGLLVLAALLPSLMRAVAGSQDRLTIEPTVAPSVAGRLSRVRDPRAGRYLEQLLFLTLLATITSTWVDFVFKAEVAERVPTDRLGEFFGTFNMGLSLAALVAQVAIAPRLLTRGGVGRTLLVTPGALTLASLLALLIPGFAAVILLRGLDGALRHSMHRSSLEVLYLPLSSNARARWKMAVEVLGQRGGQALAALVILAAIHSGMSLHGGIALVLTMGTGWLVLAATLERGYLALFRAKVKAGAIETRAGVPALDLRSMESLVAALGSANDEEVLAAIELLRDFDRARAIPSLLLYHPSRTVVLRTLEVFASDKRVDIAGAARRLLERDDDELRAAAMLTLAGSMTEVELRGELARPLDVATRAAALVAMLARGLDHDGSAAVEIALGCEPTTAPATRFAYAHALRLQGGASCAAYLPRLLQGAGPDLELEVAQGMLAARDVAFVPHLIRLLDSRNARPIAREALIALGEPALLALERATEDVAISRRLRGHLPRSIGRFGSARAADILLDRLERERDGWVRFKVVRGLGYVREHMRSHARERRALAAARRNAVAAVRFLSLSLAVDAAQRQHTALRTRGGELLLAVLRDKVARAIDRAVRLVGLSLDPNVIHNIRQALATRDTRLRADSVELLLHGAPSDLAAGLAALLELGTDGERLTRAAAALEIITPPRRYEDTLRHMLDGYGSAVRALAAYHMGELGMQPPTTVTADALSDPPSALSRDVLARIDELRVRASQEPGSLPVPRRVP